MTQRAATADFRVVQDDGSIPGRPRGSKASLRLQPLVFVTENVVLPGSYEEWAETATQEDLWMHKYVPGMARAMGWPEHGEST